MQIHRLRNDEYSKQESNALSRYSRNIKLAFVGSKMELYKNNLKPWSPDWMHF